MKEEAEMKTLHSLHEIDIEPGETGTTVRKGLKWAFCLDEPVELCVCDHGGPDGNHHIVGHAVANTVWSGAFRNIPARLIENEHELRSRVYSGLLDSMRKGYGPEFSEDDFCVVLEYARKD